MSTIVIIHNRGHVFALFRSGRVYVIGLCLKNVSDAEIMGLAAMSVRNSSLFIFFSLNDGYNVINFF